MTQKVKAEEFSSLWENWRHFQKTREKGTVFEYPVFSDANISGRIDAEEIFFSIESLHSLTPSKPGKVLPVLLIRCPEYNSASDESFSGPKPAIHHDRGGIIQEQIAALLSLRFARRFRAGKYTRVFSEDTSKYGMALAMWDQPNFDYFVPYKNSCLIHESCRSKEIEACELFSKFPNIQKSAAQNLIKAARQYQTALWLAETEPNMCWLFMVSAIEVAANYWKSGQATPVERLEDSNLRLKEILYNAGGDSHVEEVAKEIADYMGAGKKFQDFLIRFIPDPPESHIPDGLKIDWSHQSLRKIFRKVYSHRSNLVHTGTPFPYPMCEPFSQSDVMPQFPDDLYRKNQVDIRSYNDSPIHLWVFAHIVQGALLNWWRSLIDENEPSD